MLEDVIIIPMTIPIAGPPLEPRVDMVWVILILEIHRWPILSSPVAREPSQEPIPSCIPTKTVEPDRG